MLTKFETRSNRVKGISFHSTRPWIICSLHSGSIQLWDYRMELLISTFDEHEGPVRTVDFHTTQPLFVSGGDDYKIKIWNYTLKRCLFNLLGHLDYIRTVSFHNEHPWIISSSDDQTARIWNWQNRQCLAVLTGHNHYVMCAQFHPKDDLVLTCSLDQTIRVWDTSNLRKKHVSIGVNMGNKQKEDQDMFGSNSDVTVKFVLEGHTRGVNWASFHKTQPLIVSGADDRAIKLWRMTDAKCWEADAFSGHTNNVSCVMFHPRRDNTILSNSEDKSVRIWDTTKQAPPQTWRRDSDRFWILAAHPNVNMLAAGHDTGLVVFKLERERPAFDSNTSTLIYYKDRYIRMRDLASSKETSLICVRRPGSVSSIAPRTLSYNFMNTSEHSFIIFTSTPADGGAYELCTFKKNAATIEDSNGLIFKSPCLAVCFTSRTRVAILENSTTISLKNLQHETKKKITTPFPCNFMFPATIGHCLLRTNESIVLFELEARKVVGKITTLARHPIKYVQWSKTHKYVALVSKFLLYVCDANLTELCMIAETAKIKSVQWDGTRSGVLIYTTSTHIKFLLPNGDNGIIRTLDVPIYMIQINDSSMSCLDRETKIKSISLDSTEYAFKMALQTKNYANALKIMQSEKLVGQAIISYLHRKGYPEIALHFVQDTKTKFSLALECGNIKLALDCARELNTTDCWHKLGVEALRQGNHQIVEMAYQKTKNFERLSFLYLITGNFDKLQKMLAIAQLRKDVQARFHNALLLGNVEDRISVLQEVGQLNLAYLTAKTHGLDDLAAEIETKLEKIPDISSDFTPALLMPPIPILREDNWPLVEVGTELFQSVDSMLAASVQEEKEVENNVTHIDGFDDDIQTSVAVNFDGGDGGWDALDIDIPVEQQTEDSKQEVMDNSDPNNYFLMPNAGPSPMDRWAESSNPGVLAASGRFDVAVKQLQRQIGLMNVEPLKSHFSKIYQATHARVPLFPNLGIKDVPLTVSTPTLLYQASDCLELLKVAYKSVTEGKFAAALDQFRSILHTIPLLLVEKPSKELAELVGVCREYITALRLELARRDVKDPIRQFELSLYFSRCDLQAIHVFLGLRVAIKCGYTVKCFKTTASLCRKLLELCVSAKLPQNLLQGVDQIKNVLKSCEKNEVDEVSIKYDDRPYSIDCLTFTPLHRNIQVYNCCYCGSTYENDGELCENCLLSKVGVQGDGLNFLKVR